MSFRPLARPAPVVAAPPGGNIFEETFEGTDEQPIISRPSTNTLGLGQSFAWQFVQQQGDPMAGTEVTLTTPVVSSWWNKVRPSGSPAIPVAYWYAPAVGVDHWVRFQIRRAGSFLYVGYCLRFDPADFTDNIITYTASDSVAMLKFRFRSSAAPAQSLTVPFDSWIIAKAEGALFTVYQEDSPGNNFTQALSGAQLTGNHCGIGWIRDFPTNTAVLKYFQCGPMSELPSP